jgi:hypothetical protein
LKIFVEDRTVTQEVHVLQSLPLNLLLGNDFIQKHSLLYDIENVSSSGPLSLKTRHRTTLTLTQTPGRIKISMKTHQSLTLSLNPGKTQIDSKTRQRSTLTLTLGESKMNLRMHLRQTQTPGRTKMNLMMHSGLTQTPTTGRTNPTKPEALPKRPSRRRESISKERYPRLRSLTPWGNSDYDIKLSPRAACCTNRESAMPHLTS